MKKSDQFILVASLVIVISLMLMPLFPSEIEVSASIQVELPPVPVVMVTPSAEAQASNEKVQPIPKVQPKEEYYAAEKSCVFNTIFKDVESDSLFECTIPLNVKAAIAKSVGWMADMQRKDGGWSCFDDINKKPMQWGNGFVDMSDVGTTSMAAMSIIRCDDIDSKREHEDKIRLAIQFVCRKSLQNAEKESSNPALQNFMTQPQMKLGKNIDAVLASQFLMSAIRYFGEGDTLQERMTRACEIYMDRVISSFDESGNVVAGSWAAALQSSLATSAIERAMSFNYPVDTSLLHSARDYQMSRIDCTSKKVRTDDAAGILLYAVSGAARTTAADARRATEILALGKEKNLIKKNEEMNAQNLVKCGLTESKAIVLNTAWHVNTIAKEQSRQKKVLNGFGNNGGEEFISFLQTGEALITSYDNEWKKWYFDTCKSLMNIQQGSGYWAGHHCITSPVFCTAVCMLVLGIAAEADEIAGSGVAL